ncbi:MAG: methyltransferase [Propionicimonas sp.]|nr:methyltransferase [Propionicimonas sp.]
MEPPDSADEPVVTGAGGHYFDTTPSAASRPSTVRLDLPDRSLELHTDRGVFSPDRIDPGTKLLLMELPQPADLPAGPVADVGCGYGPIATALAARGAGPVWAVDVNSRARDLCRANLARHAPPGTEVHVVDPTAVPADLRVGTIVSNPPIRVGKSALHGLLDTWLARLAPEGEAWLVVQKHLGADSLARWLEGRGHAVDRVRSRQGYRILRVAPAAPVAVA